MAASPTLADPARVVTRVCPGRPVFICKERGGRFRRGWPPWRTTVRPGTKRLAHHVWDRTAGLLQKLGITLPSLPRTGRASLLASSATSTRTWRVMNSASLACLVDRFTGCPIPDSDARPRVCMILTIVKQTLFESQYDNIAFMDGCHHLGVRALDDGVRRFAMRAH